MYIDLSSRIAGVWLLLNHTSSQPEGMAGLTYNIRIDTPLCYTSILSIPCVRTRIHPGALETIASCLQRISRIHGTKHSAPKHIAGEMLQ
jgi:hypothetical protein